MRGQDQARVEEQQVENEDEDLPECYTPPIVSPAFAALQTVTGLDTLLCIVVCPLPMVGLCWFRLLPRLLQIQI